MRTTLVAVAWMLTASNAFADDVSWGGGYIGANVGAGWNDVNWAFHATGGRADHDGIGAIVGAQIGYNWQSSRWLVGAEVALSHSTIHGSDRCPGRSWSCESDVKWTTSVTAKVGYAFDDVLLYALGGIAAGQVETLSVRSPDKLSDTEYVGGWTTGFGVEYAISDFWSVKAEYVHYDFNGQHFWREMDADVSAKLKIDTGRVGINYRF